MPVKIGQNGQWVQEYFGPYAGLHVEAPETLIPDNASPLFNNFMLRNAELRSRPNLFNPFGITPQVDGLGAFDSAVSAVGTGTAVATGSLTPSSAPEYAFFGEAKDDTSGFSFTPAAGWATLGGQTYKQSVSAAINGQGAISGGGADWVAALVLFKQIGASAPTIVQTATIVSGAWTPGTNTGNFTNPVQAGNTILVVFEGNQTTLDATLTVSDGANTYTKLVDRRNATGLNPQYTMYAAQSIAAGTPTVSAHTLGVISGQILMYEIQGGTEAVSVASGVPSQQLGITTFVDVNGTYHTVIWGGQNLYQYNPALLPASPFQLVGQAAPGNMQNNTVSYRAFANAIWYTDKAALIGANNNPIIDPFVGTWNGLTSVPQFTQTQFDASVTQSVAGIALTDSPTVGGSLPGAPTVTGPLSIGGLYIGELNNQLILANVSVLDQSSGVIYSFPNLIWWSANGLPFEWDPVHNTSAGFNPFLDVPDLITGLVTLGIAGYIFRTDGITQFATTGSAITPFTFDHMWASDHGIGNVLPFSIAQYGPTACFISTDNIYSLSVSSANAIGGTARDAIFADLAVASAIPFANVVPVIENGYVYMTYQLYIPMSGFVRLYVYSFDDKNWSPWDLNIVANPPNAALTCAPNVV